MHDNPFDDKNVLFYAVEKINPAEKVGGVASIALADSWDCYGRRAERSLDQIAGDSAEAERESDRPRRRIGRHERDAELRSSQCTSGADERRDMIGIIARRLHFFLGRATALDRRDGDGLLARCGLLAKLTEPDLLCHF